MHVHLKRALRPTPPKFQKLLYSKLRQLLKQGKQIEPRIVYETNDETSALQYEAERIRYYGFENLLNNATHAFLGRRLKPEVKRMISDSLHSLWRDPAFRKQHPAPNLGKKFAYRPKPAMRKPRNQPPSNGYKGVCRWKAKGKSIRWFAKIQINLKPHCLGYFNRPEQAAKAYDDKAEEIYGYRPNNTLKTEFDGYYGYFYRRSGGERRGISSWLFWPAMLYDRDVPSPSKKGVIESSRQFGRWGLKKYTLNDQDFISACNSTGLDPKSVIVIENG